MPRIKYCFFKKCENNTFLSAEKKFFTVPNHNKAQWCSAGGLDHVPTRSLFICEDHLNLEEDVENYLFWKTMNVNACLKPRVPTFRSPSPKDTNIVGPSTSTVDLCAERARVTHANHTDELTPVPVPDNPTLCDDAETLSFGEKPEPPSVPCEPAAAPIPEFVKNRCQFCGAVNDGYHYWCVSCGLGALCGSCAATLTHELHFVLRAPTAAPKEKTQAIIKVLRRQLENENLLTPCETEETEVKVEVKQEPEELIIAPLPEPEPDPLGHLNPLIGLSEPLKPETDAPQEQNEVPEGLSEVSEPFVQPKAEVPQELELEQIGVTVPEGLSEAFDTERLAVLSEAFVQPKAEVPQDDIEVTVTEGLTELFDTDRLASETMATYMDVEFVRETDDQNKRPRLMEHSRCIKPATKNVQLRSISKHPNVIGSRSISNPAGPKTALQVFQAKLDAIKNLRAKGPIKPKITRADQFKTSLEKHPIVIVKDSQTITPSDRAGSKLGLHTYETKQIFRKKPQNKEIQIIKPKITGAAQFKTSLEKHPVVNVKDPHTITPSDPTGSQIGLHTYEPKQIFRKKPQNKEIQLIKPKITRLDQYMTALEKYKKKLKKHMSKVYALKHKNCSTQNTKATSIPTIDLLAPMCPDETTIDSEEIEFLDEDMLVDDIEYQVLKKKEQQKYDFFNKYKKKPTIDYKSDSDTESVLFTDDDKDKDYTVDEDDLTDDSMDETYIERGIGRRTRNATKSLEKGPDEATPRSLPSEATVPPQPLTSSEISKRTTDIERRRED